MGTSNSTPRRYLANLNKNARLADYSLAVLNEHLAGEHLAFGREDLGTLYFDLAADA